MKKVILLAILSATSLCVVKATDMTSQNHKFVEIKAHTVGDSTNIHEYSGKYTMKENPYIDEVILKVKNDKLVSTTPEGEEVVFQYLENDEFYISDFNAKVKFIRENGIVTSVKVHIQGKELIGEKK